MSLASTWEAVLTRHPVLSGAASLAHRFLSVKSFLRRLFQDTLLRGAAVLVFCLAPVKRFSLSRLAPPSSFTALDACSALSVFAVAFCSGEGGVFTSRSLLGQRFFCCPCRFSSACAGLPAQASLVDGERHPRPGCPLATWSRRGPLPGPVGGPST